MTKERRWSKLREWLNPAGSAIDRGASCSMPTPQNWPVFAPPQWPAFTPPLTAAGRSTIRMKPPRS